MAHRHDGCGISPDDCKRIVESTFIERVEFHPQLRSTNDRAMELARESMGTNPALVLAAQQTAGRGRGKNSWWSGKGALTFSVLIEADSNRLPPRRWPQTSLTTGLAVCEGIETFLTGRAVQLKWPNDVYIDRRKVCGVLVESPRDQPGMLVLGIGINVNNSLRHAPKELQRSATALCDAGERPFSLFEVLQQVLARLEQRLRWVGNRDDELRRMWRQRCLLTNRTVCIDLGSRDVVGRCQGIDEEGALIVDTDMGRQRCFAGVVTRF